MQAKKNVVYQHTKKNKGTLCWSQMTQSHMAWKTCPEVYNYSSLCLIFRSLCTFTGQKYFHTKIFPYIFHIKPLIFKTFSWSHSLSDFLEIFTFKSRIDWSLFTYFHVIFLKCFYNNLWVKHKHKFSTSQFSMII